MHGYYFKDNMVWDYQPKSTCSWFMRAILKQREYGLHSQVLQDASVRSKFITKLMYMEICGERLQVPWKLKTSF